MKLNELSERKRVQLHPATDLWMRGARYGTVTQVGRKYVRVYLDRLGKAVLVHPDDVLEVVH